MNLGNNATTLLTLAIIRETKATDATLRPRASEHHRACNGRLFVPPHSRTLLLDNSLNLLEPHFIPQINHLAFLRSCFPRYLFLSLHREPNVACLRQSMITSPTTNGCHRSQTTPASLNSRHTAPDGQRTLLHQVSCCVALMFTFHVKMLMSSIPGGCCAKAKAFVL